MQADTDTYVLEDPKQNLVELMKTEGLYLTNKPHFFYEGKDFFRGLPELAQVRGQVAVVSGV